MPLPPARRLKTYEHQDKLPRLPVPELEDTLRRYLTSLEPFISKEELETSRAVARDFAKPGGDGQALQQILLQRAKERYNWLAEWWESAAYLSDRTPNALFINMISGFGAFQEFERPVPQARRAAEIIRYTCEYAELLKREAVPPETMGGKILCMNMFRRLFSSCRIPSKPADYFERVDMTTVRHIIVMSEGRIFALRAYDDSDKLLTIGDLEAQLLLILKHSEHLSSLDPRSCSGDMQEENAGASLGALTSLNRDKWADVRQDLVSYDARNHNNLKTIQSSLFAVCLDSTTPHTPSELAKECAMGSSGNRWYDKSFQYVVFRNGMVGSNMEHANADATVLQSMYRWLGERYLHRIGGYETFIESRQQAFLPSPELLRWRLPPSLTSSGAIPRAMSDIATHGQLLHTRVTRTDNYGKSVLRSLGLFPDTFVQMGIQLAGYRTWGRAVPTYESGHTRMFVEGRTETIRTVTNEVKQWLEAATRSPSAMKSKDVYELLAAAMMRHKQISMESLVGQGIDRHLLGLQVAAMQSGRPLHGLFSDPAYTKCGGGGNFVLSTSNVSGYPWLWGGFVPMVPHGIGVCYGCENDFLAFIITSFDAPKDDGKHWITAENFEVALFAAFDDIAGLMALHHKRTPPSPATHSKM